MVSANFLEQLKSKPTVALAPMAGISDRAFRNLCREQGADYAVSEMVASKKELWHSLKSSTRHVDQTEPEPRITQLLGTEPQMLAEAARWQYEQGANVIDLNMGCPAKKVCDVAAGSALLAFPEKIQHILRAVVDSVPIPVTLKIRTGTDNDNRNAPTIAQLAEASGIQLLTIHGRTRADKFSGKAEYDTIKKIKTLVDIPIIANGDICTPKQADFVLEYTACDGIMIGRAAQGNPWIFKEVQNFLQGEPAPYTTPEMIQQTMLTHLQALHQLYGASQGVRIARKHIGWYCQTLSNKQHFSERATTQLRKQFNQLNSAETQLEKIESFFYEQSNPVKPTCDRST